MPYTAHNTQLLAFEWPHTRVLSIDLKNLYQHHIKVLLNTFHLSGPKPDFDKYVVSFSASLATKDTSPTTEGLSSCSTAFARHYIAALYTTNYKFPTDPN